MNKSRVLLLLACIVAITGATNPAKANLILNGSFESPGLQDGIYQYQPNPPWVGSGYILAGNWGGWPNPQDGRQFQFLANYDDDTIWQSFNVVTPGTYTLTWYDNSYLTDPSYGLYVKIGNSDWSTYSDYTFSGSGAPAWNARSVSVTLNAGLNTLLFRTDSETALDNVVLEAAAVPEPSTYIAGALLFLPFGAHFVRRLRHRD